MADLSDFVLEQVLERLDQLELHLFGQAAHVVMRLDNLRRSAHRTRLDHIGIERTLHQPLDLAFTFLNPPGFPLEYFDEFVADNLALLLGIADAFELAEKAVGGIDGIETQAKFIAQRLLHLLEFVFAQHTVVHENAGQARLPAHITQGAIDQYRSDGRIHAAGKGADGPSAAHLPLHLLDG